MFADQMNNCMGLTKELFLEGKGMNNRLALVLTVLTMRSLRRKSQSNLSALSAARHHFPPHPLLSLQS